MSLRAGRRWGVRCALAILLLVACDAEPRDRPDAGELDAAVTDAAPDTRIDAPNDVGVDGTDAGPLDAGAGLTIESYCEQASRLWCMWLDDCGGGCDAFFAARDPEWCAAAMAAVDEGRLAYDAEQGQACVARLTEVLVDCADDGPLAGCSPFEGLVAFAEPCYGSHPFGDDECAGEAICQGSLDYAGFCPGSCVMGGIIGDLCDETPCAPGFRCTDEICLPLLEIGDDCSAEPCLPELRCQPLEGTLRCVVGQPVGATCSLDPGQRCVTGATCVSGRCIDAAPTGTACWDSAQCSAVDWCDPGTGICVPRPGEGEPCLGPCASGECVDDASSTTGRRCLRPVGEGEVCDPAPCESDLRCIGGACAARTSGSCTTTAECVEERWCDGSTCRLPAAEGEPCGICDAGLFCEDGTCTVTLPNAAPCTANEECGVASDCIDLDGIGLRCRARRICNAP